MVHCNNSFIDLACQNSNDSIAIPEEYDLRYSHYLWQTNPQQQSSSAISTPIDKKVFDGDFGQKDHLNVVIAL